MAKERSNKERLDDIEKDLGDVKKQVTNDIPHKLTELEETDGFIYKQVCENAETGEETLAAVNEIVKTLMKYTPFARPSEGPGV